MHVCFFQHFIHVRSLVENLGLILWIILCSTLSLLTSMDAVPVIPLLMKKSLTSEMLIRSKMCDSSQRRIKSMAVRLTVSISCPSSISHIKPMFWFLMPTSTMDCVRKGRISCNKLPTSSPKAIWPKYRRYFLCSQIGIWKNVARFYPLHRKCSCRIQM